jgi:hypothetical protein
MLRSLAIVLAAVSAASAPACSKASGGHGPSGDGGGGATGSTTTTSDTTSGTGGTTGSITTTIAVGGSGTGGTTTGCPGAGGSDSGTPGKTVAGVALPSGWSLQVSDRFGTGPNQTVGTFAALHAKYYEGQYYNRDANGLVKIPNVVINDEQETYVHFEQSIAFSCDHLTIQGRGQPDGSITSGEIVSIRSARSFCVEARYRIPSTDKSWPAFWFYGDANGHDLSEIDVEQPVTANQGVDAVSMYNHPTSGTLTIVDSHFTSQWMTWTNTSFDGSAAPHTYTACYDDGASVLTRYIDGGEIYSSVWKWNASLGGTGKGPDASTIVNLAVGGNWPGNTTFPRAYTADLDLYWIDYYGP